MGTKPSVPAPYSRASEPVTFRMPPLSSPPRQHPTPDALTDQLANLDISQAASSPQSMKPPGTSIDDLPPEILMNVFDIIMEEEGHTAYQCSFLCKMCLVGKDWLYPARVLLWRHVFVETERRALQLLESGGLGVYQTLSLTISGKGGFVFGVTPESTQNILSKVKELDTLAIKRFPDYGKLDGTVLASSNLSTITSLELDSVYINLPDQLTTLPFSLKSLHLYHCLSNRRDHFSLFYSPFLTEFFLVHNYGSIDELHLTSFITSIGPQLVKFTYYDKHSFLLPSMIPLFSKFDNLKHLHIMAKDDQLITIAKTLNGDLEELLIAVDQWSDSVTRKNTFKAVESVVGLPCCRNLRELVFPVVKSEFTRLPEGIKMIIGLESKGIKVRFADTGNEDW